MGPFLDRDSDDDNDDNDDDSDDSDENLEEWLNNSGRIDGIFTIGRMCTHSMFDHFSSELL